MARLVIWHPEIFTPEEMSLPESRAFNPQGCFFVSTVWPVVEFMRPRLDTLPQHPGRLYLDASERSFRFTRPYIHFSVAELDTFKARLGRLTSLYKRIGAWIRRHLVKVDRGLYRSASLADQAIPRQA